MRTSAPTATTTSTTASAPTEPSPPTPKAAYRSTSPTQVWATRFATAASARNSRLLAYLKAKWGHHHGHEFAKYRLRPFDDDANAAGLLASDQRRRMGQARTAHRPGTDPMRVPVLWCSRPRRRPSPTGTPIRGFLEAMLNRSVWTPPDAVTFDPTRSTATSPTCPAPSSPSTAVLTPHRTTSSGSPGNWTGWSGPWSCSAATRNGCFRGRRSPRPNAGR